MKTRWGGANLIKKNIRLNTDLATKPIIFLEYVILHELGHFLEPSHNERLHFLMDLHLLN